MEVEKCFATSALIDREYNYFNCLAPLPRGFEKAGLLRGYFITVKDNICTKGIATTAGSAILRGYVPPFNATAVQRCLDAGALLLGKTAMDEFGFGSFSTNIGLGFKVPLNPYDKERVCGGSSGGAAGFAAKAPFPHIAIAESTGGSIVNPAAFCGVVGLCPTYGRVSRWGLVDYASSLDKIGPIAKTVSDCALALGVMAGGDGKDATCSKKPVPNYFEEMNRPGKLRIGILKEGFSDGIQPEVQLAVRDAAKKLESEGNELKTIELPITMRYGIPCYYIIAMAEASTNLARYCGIRYGAALEIHDKHFDDYFSEVRASYFGKEAKRRVILGTFARMAGYREAYYLRACKIRTKIIEEYKRVFKEVDLILSPTMPIVAPRFDEIENLTPVQNYMMDLLTVGPNLAGVPHINIPFGKSKGLPIGVMLAAQHLKEGVLLKGAFQLEG